MSFLFKKILNHSLCFCLLLGCLSGCKKTTPRTQLLAVATTSFAADLVKHIAGDTLEVQGLMGPGIDPHLYRATTRDVVLLSKADIIVYNGLMLEGRMSDLLDHRKKQGKRVYALAEALPKESLIALNNSHGQADPHIWFDPELWILAMEGVAAQLSQIQPQHQALYKERTQALSAEYRKLHAWGRKYIENIPTSMRVLITSHDAFNYFGRAFGVEVIGVQGISTDTEPGVQDISQTVRLIKERKLKAIFVESSVAPKTIEQIAKNAGVHVGGELFSDAMGIPGTLRTRPDGSAYDVGTWSGMLQHNICVLVEGLLEDGRGK